MPIKKNLETFDSPIVFMHPHHSPILFIITADHTLYFYDTSTQSREKILHLKVAEDALLLYAFDPHTARLIFGSNQSTILNLIDLKEKKLQKRFELDQQYPTAIAFAPDGLHFICGTDQGRVLLWRSEANSLVARLHSYPEYASFYTKPKINYVSALVFEGDWVATSGYGGNIVMTDYQSQIQSKRFHLGALKNHSLLFFNHAIIAGNQEGTLLKVDREGKYPNQRLSTSLGAILHLQKIGLDPYILAVTKQSVALVNADTMKMINEHYIVLDHPITAVCKENAYLYLSTLSGELYQYDLQPLKHLEELINSKAYAEAYRYCEEEPLLKENQIYQMLESFYHQTYDKARHLLEKGETLQAKAILERFEPIKSKENAELMNAFSYMKRFSYLFENQKLSPFYGLAERYPLLQSTLLYQRTEKLWSEKFTKAQKLMMIGKSKEAQTELEPFWSVSSKYPFIQLLLHQIDLLKKYSQAIHAQDYRQLNQLTQHYPILRKFPSYNQLINEAGERISAITQAIKNKAFDHAQLLLSELREVVQYEEKYVQLHQFFTLALNLNHAILHHHWNSAYQLLDAHPDLAILPWAEELEGQWHQKLLQCETYAVQGDLHSIKKELGNLIHLPNRNERIGDILRMAYRIQLTKLLTQDTALFLSGAENYCDLFGIDTELRQLLKKAKREKIDILLGQEHLLPKKWDHWLLYSRKLPDSIA
jgi:hypothetical protein